MTRLPLLLLVVFGVACGRGITVEGRLVDSAGVAIIGQVVLNKEGERQPAYADREGRFRFEDVRTPYTVRVTTMASIPPTVIIYEGLTRPDPTITAFVLDSACNQAGWGRPCNAKLSGTVTGGGSEPGLVTRVAFSARDTLLSMEASDAGTWSVTYAWWGRKTLAGELAALQWQPAATGLPATYTGFGTRPGVTFASGDTLTAQDLALAPVGAAQVSGETPAPEGYALKRRTLGVRFGDVGYLPIAVEAAPAVAFAFQVPTIAGGVPVVRTEVASPAGDVAVVNQRLPPGTSGASATFPVAPTLVSPAAGATGVAQDARFEWTKLEGAAQVLSVAGVDSRGATAAVLVIVTDAASAGAPTWNTGDATRFLWTVLASPAYPTVDAFAAGAVNPAFSTTTVNAPNAYDADFGGAIAGVREFFRGGSQ